MKDSIRLSIPKPCGERWSNFTVTTHGGFCNSCSKTVIDFTVMSDAEILDFFSKKPEHTCGRFLPGQLKVYEHAMPTLRPGLSLLRAGMVAIMVVLAGNQVSAQQNPKRVQDTEQNATRSSQNITSSLTEVSVKGIVKDESGVPLPGTNVLLVGTEKGTVADSNGRFEFPQKLHPGDVLNFSFIGFESIRYVVGNAVNDLDLEMRFSGSDLVMLGDVAVESPQQSPRGLRKIWNQVKRIL